LCLVESSSIRGNRENIFRCKVLQCIGVHSFPEVY
jgi:hypothetical protein